MLAPVAAEGARVLLRKDLPRLLYIGRAVKEEDVAVQFVGIVLRHLRLEHLRDVRRVLLLTLCQWSVQLLIATTVGGTSPHMARTLTRGMRFTVAPSPIHAIPNVGASLRRSSLFDAMQVS